MLKLTILHGMHKYGLLENTLHREKKENQFIYSKKIKERNLVKISIILLIALILLLVGSMWGYSKKLEALAIQEGIANEVIRFHVVANSDSKEDQQLKLKVKSKVVEMLQMSLKEAKNIEEARNIIKTQFKDIEKISKEVIIAQGYSYEVSVGLERKQFPIKRYGDVVLPPGEYEALLINIGEAQGKNWWCIVFPTLCYVDETYEVVPDASKEQLKYLLSEEEYRSIVQDGNMKVRVKFKLLDWIKDLF